MNDGNQQTITLGQSPCFDRISRIAANQYSGILKLNILLNHIVQYYLAQNDKDNYIQYFKFSMILPCSSGTITTADAMMNTSCWQRRVGRWHFAGEMLTITLFGAHYVEGGQFADSEMRLTASSRVSGSRCIASALQLAFVAMRCYGAPTSPSATRWVGRNHPRTWTFLGVTILHVCNKYILISLKYIVSYCTWAFFLMQETCCLNLFFFVFRPQPWHCSKNVVTVVIAEKNIMRLLRVESQFLNMSYRFCSCDF